MNRAYLLTSASCNIAGYAPTKPKPRDGAIIVSARLPSGAPLRRVATNPSPGEYTIDGDICTLADHDAIVSYTY